MGVYRRILKYLKPYWNYSLGAFLCMIIVAVCNILVIPLIGKLSSAIGAKSFEQLNLVILYIMGVYTLRAFASYGQVYLMAFATQRVVRDLRIQVFSHLHDLSLDFFSKWRTGDIMSRVLNDINKLETFFISSVTEVMPNFVTLIGVLGYLFYLNWRLTAITLLIIPIIGVISSYFGKNMRRASEAAQKKIDTISSMLQETISGARIVKSFAMEKHEVKKFKAHSEDNFWIMMQQNQITATQIPLLGLVQFFAIAAVVWYGGFEVVSGRLAAENLIAFFAGIALLADPIAKLGLINTIMQIPMVSAKRIFEVIDIKPKVMESKNALSLPHIKGNIKFEKVSFQYENNTAHVLKDISIEIPAGKLVALVGPSGAGKSTFANLIPRFYDPIQGKISIDSYDLKEVKLFDLRSQMGIVPQETILFSGTVKENIAYGMPEASDEAIIKAAQISHAHEFILELPQKYSTLVGERGIKLSGGQRQRLAIARALLKDPRILIFDEATSALDIESERFVQDAMENLIKGRTTIVIAHRLSTVQHADMIIVLDKGKIVEVGNHESLIQQLGLYKRLYELQFKEDAEKE